MADDAGNVTLASVAAVVTAIEDVVRIQRFCADQAGDTHAVTHLAAGRPWLHVPPPRRALMPPAERNHVLQTAAIGTRWQRNSRIACLVDPTIAEECAAATADAMPTDIVAQLPYRDPLVVFTTPIPCRTTDDRPARLLGYFLYGVTMIPDDNGALCGTHDDPDYLGIMPILDTLDNSGVGPEVNRFLMLLRVERVDIAEFLDSCVANWSADAITAARASEASIRSCLQQILRPVLGSMLYLCSKEPDLQDPRPKNDRPRTRERGPGKPHRSRRTTAFIQVGWRLGANLRRLRRAATSQPTTATPGAATGRTQPPRQRASHFKVVWTGPGRTIPRLAFVMPYWIHKDQLGLDTLTSTLVPTSTRRGRRRGKRSR